MRERHDVIIAGTGIAGLTAAIRAREDGLDVLVITKQDRIEETNTNYAQGGIIADPAGSDSELLERDVLEAGCRINNHEAVRLFAHEASPLVYDFLIDRIGTRFSHKADGSYDYTEEAAHSIRRILHFEDHTGDTIESALIAYARKIGVEIRTGCTAVDIIVNSFHSTDPQERYHKREVFGLYALDNATGEVRALLADAVILATGGIGNVFQFTTNPSSATGDGLSIAHRAGADIINAEYTQFHPTALYHRDIKRFLISESLRGEGAILLNRKGEPFMKRYDERGELAPRDIVSRAIYEEMSVEGSEYMLLDLSTHYRGEKPIRERFSRIYDTCMGGGIDISRQPIPVVPAAHYFCGGIRVDGNGRTSLDRLYAVGEVSCTGLHGANRLASTSLLEGLLWGYRAAADIARSLDDGHGHARIASGRLDSISDWKTPTRAERFESALIYQDWKMIKLTMWNHAGIVRTRKSLERAQADLDYHAHRITKFYRESVLDRDIIELRNGVITAQLVTDAALRNETSIGCHFRKN
jgi:L-aspartate oxidase